MSDPFVKIVLASVSPQKIPLITVHMRYWRGIHSEIMTHRAFSRNARSSRAVPIQKLIDEVKIDPFVPRHWGKNQKGMQASEECNEKVNLRGPLMFVKHDFNATREEAWRFASEQAVCMATSFMEAGYHKQIVNRILEPYMWIDTLVTSTDWANFFALRDHPDAEPHFRDLAALAREEFLRYKGKFQILEPGQWHLPFMNGYIDEETGTRLSYPWVTTTEASRDFYVLDIARKISAARCARISYAPFDGRGDVASEVDRYYKLVLNKPVHASPVEHQATPDYQIGDRGWAHPDEHRNFRGWRQNRATIEGETEWDANDDFMRSLIE